VIRSYWSRCVLLVSKRLPDRSARWSASDRRAPYAVEATPEARRHLDRLPPKVLNVVLAAIFESVAVNPRRAGKPLRGELGGLH